MAEDPEFESYHTICEMEFSRKLKIYSNSKTTITISNKNRTIDDIRYANMNFTAR